jgi:hypothetical protein
MSSNENVVLVITEADMVASPLFHFGPTGIAAARGKASTGCGRTISSDGRLSTGLYSPAGISM